MRIAIALLLLSGGAWAQTGEMEQLRQDLEKANRRIEALEKDKEKRDLEKELEAEMEKPSGGGAKPGDVASVSLGGGVQARLVDLSFDATVAAGWSSARDEVIRELNAGHHDPKRRGFTLQNLEITGSGAVDPYFNGEIHVILTIDPDGETEVELEEAFLTTTCLPWGFQVKAGQMFEAFGRQNAQHPHAWQFVDQPVVMSRFLGGDGLRSQGVEASWLAPTPWYLLATAGVYNANGETAHSFINDEESPFYVNAEGREVRTARDLQYLARIGSSLDFGDTVTAAFGASWAHGPNSTGSRADTDLFGADLYVRWKPLQNERGWPFLQLQAEWMGRAFEQVTGFDDDGNRYEHEVFWDWGYYVQGVWGFLPGWTAGARWEQAHGERAHDEPDDFRFDPRYRIAAALTFYPTEFSRIRLQYNYDHGRAIRSNHGTLRDEHSVWLQVEFLLGKHGAHKF